MALAINRLIGEEVDAYKDIYHFQLSQIKNGIEVPAIQLMSNSDTYNYYRLLDTLGHFADFQIKHDINSDRRHFSESTFANFTFRSKIKIPIFYKEHIKIEYIFKKEKTLLFDGLVVQGFKSSAQNFQEVLNKNNNKGTIKFQLLDSGDDRTQFEDKFFGKDLDIIPNLEQDAKRNLTDFLVDPSYADGRSRLKLFYPNLTAKQINKMDKSEITSHVNSINFKSLGIKTVDAYLYFFDIFSKYYITNSQLMKKTTQIDAFLTKYLDK